MDGRGDTVFIQFFNPITMSQLPSVVTNIQWVGGAQLGIANNNMHVNPNDPTQIIIATIMPPDEGGFNIGTKTALTIPNPTLTLPDDNIFRGQKPIIQDSMGAVIIKAEKFPSDLETYFDLLENIYKKNPYTLRIELSEQIFPTDLAGPDYSNLILFADTNEVKYLLKIDTIVIDPEDPTVWIIIFPNVRSDAGLKAGDNVFLNRNAPFVDAKGNSNIEKPQIVKGFDASGELHFSEIYLNIEGENDLINTNINNYVWIQPVGFNPVTSTIDEKTYTAECTVGDNKLIQFYPQNCLSTVLVYSENRYVVSIEIFDPYGILVHSHTQNFGYCGELENNNRNSVQGLVKFLVWNQQDDLTHAPVPSGVYIWKTKFVYENERVYEST